MKVILPIWLMIVTSYAHGAADSSISKATFNKVLDRIESRVQPRFEDVLGSKIRLHRDYESTEDHVPDRNNVYANGKYLRYPEITADAFALAICFEYQRFAIFYPRVNGRVALLAKNHFLIQNCAKPMWQDDVIANSLFRGFVPAALKSQCDSVYVKQDEQNLCYRIAVASYNLARMNGTPVSVASKSSKVADGINGGFVSGQCYFDNFVAAALCNIDPSKIQTAIHDQTDFEANACVNAEIQHAKPPKCWYNP